MIRRGILLDFVPRSAGGPQLRLGGGALPPGLGPVAEAGFHAIEMFIDPNPAGPGDREAVCAFAKAAKDNGIDLYSVHVPFSRDLSVLDPPAREEAIDGIRRTAALAARAGARYVIVHPGSLTDDVARPARTEVSIAGLLKLNSFCRNLGLRMAVENMLPGHVGSGVAGIRAILDRLPNDVGLCFDTGHVNVTDGDPAAALDLVASRLYTLHVHDNDGKDDQHLVPGEGGIQWPGVAGNLARHGFEGVFMLEIGGKREPAELLSLGREACDRILPPLEAARE